MNLRSKSLRNGLASNAFVYTNVKDTCQGFPETLLSHLEERFFLFGRTEPGFRGNAPNMHSAFVRTNALLAVPLRGRYDKAYVID